MEYLYIDQQRLDSYGEQISSQVVYNTAPAWKATREMSPSIEAGIDKQGRPFTDPEKIHQLMDYLQKNNLLRKTRPSDVNTPDQMLFCLETCTASKIYIPARQGAGETKSGINLWVSQLDRAETKTQPIEQVHLPALDLFLIENSPNSDENYEAPISIISALDYLIADVEEDLLYTVIAENIRLTEGERQVLLQRTNFADGDKKELRWGRMRVLGGRIGSGQDFAASPALFLGKLGAIASEARKITTLYRIKATFPHEDKDKLEARYLDDDQAPSVVTFGYPVFIANAV